MANNRWTRLLGSQAALLLIAAIAGTIHNSTEWTDGRSLVMSLLFTSISLSPAIGVVAFVDTKLSTLIVATFLASLGSVAMWVAFAGDRSSTAIFVYGYGWIVGMPLAFAASTFRCFQRIPPPPPPVR